MGRVRSLDEYWRKRRWSDLLMPALVRGGTLHSARALQHLKEGFNRRVLMMDWSIRQLEEAAAKAGGKPISPYAATELATHLGAMYLNMCGALDNLAWSLQHERRILADASEDGRSRLSVGLFTPVFLAALAEALPTLHSRLVEHTSWNTDLRDLRDPGAHRIPIYAVPGILDEKRAAEAERLFSESTRLIVAGKDDEGMDLMFQASNLGTYQPLMVLSHDGRFEVRNIKPQMDLDTDHFVEVSESVLEELLPDDTSTA